MNNDEILYNNLFLSGRGCVISFSLYGSEKKYLNGAVENAKLAKIYYLNWKVIFYVSTLIPRDIITSLLEEGVDVVIMNYPERAAAMMWRWLPFLNQNNEVVIVRDCDSRLSMRESMAVQEWLYSNKALHVMRDHPEHLAFVMGGMWGGKVNDVGFLLNFLKDDNIFYCESGYGFDQSVLEAKVYRYLVNNVFTHDEYTLLSEKRRPFPSVILDISFVGETIENNGLPNLQHRIDLEKHKKSYFKKMVLFIKTFIKRMIFLMLLRIDKYR